MSHPRLAKIVRPSIVTALLIAAAPAAFAEGFLTCRQKCPPPFVHCQEGPPRIRFKCACPKPVCDPCNLEHHGYYQTCWRPWSFPPDARHCSEPLPSVELHGVDVAPAIEAPEASSHLSGPTIKLQ